MLVIPAIEITHGKCACLIQSLPDMHKAYPDDPVEVAKIWRMENAKALYLVDIDGENSNEPQNWEILERIVKNIDIPVIIDGGFNSHESVERAIELGILRIVLEMNTFKDLSLLKSLIENFTSKRIALKIVAKNGYVDTIHAVEIAHKVKDVGIERVIYKDLTDDGYVNFEALKDFASRSNLKVTAFGELHGYQELKRLTEIERQILGVDSIVMSRSLYHNRFPCQHLWRLAEAEIL